MTTPTDKTIQQRRRAAATGAVLVPILERLLEEECIPEDAEDFRFLDMLVRARALPRRKGVFSPSMLGSCMRQAYFAKRNTEKHVSKSPQMNGYFLNGNFVHFKWQFAMWKGHRAGVLELATVPIEHELVILRDLRESNMLSLKEYDEWAGALNFNGNGTRPGVEVRVVDGDFGGTIDVLAHMTTPETSYNTHVIDFKGINLIDYQRTIKKGAKPEYRKQIVGYAKVANKTLALNPPVENCLLVSECKAGPVPGSGSPIALHETLVPVALFEGEVNRRLKTLRFADQKGDMPPAECQSTLHMCFQECGFNRFCRDEVLVTQRERERIARARNKPTTVARSRR